MAIKNRSAGIAIERFEFRQVGMGDSLVTPLLEELADEYSSRYGHRRSARDLFEQYQPEEFMPPVGALVLLLEQGRPVAGGAFRKLDEDTAELKRMWTHSAHRKRGFGLRVVAELERVAAQRGYRRIFLTTGPRQPEAKALYLSAGYRPLFDLDANPLEIGPLRFEKFLRPNCTVHNGRWPSTEMPAT
jgi:GNAT superfamily N-acetyltransferase